VSPEAPPAPVVAVLDEPGLAVAAPDAPPVAAEDVVDAPVSPEIASPVDEAVAAPDDPPVADTGGWVVPVGVTTVNSALPELPEVTVTLTAPLPPAPLTVPEDAVVDAAVPVPPV
jgi:hypothetical protein